jgi:hypothetical protein
LKPVFHFIGSRVETGRRFQAVGPLDSTCTAPPVLDEEHGAERAFANLADNLLACARACACVGGGGGFQKVSFHFLVFCSGNDEKVPWLGRFENRGGAAGAGAGVGGEGRRRSGNNVLLFHVSSTRPAPPRPARPRVWRRRGREGCGRFGLSKNTFFISRGVVVYTKMVRVPEERKKREGASGAAGVPGCPCDGSPPRACCRPRPFLGPAWPNTIGIGKQVFFVT